MLLQPFDRTKPQRCMPFSLARKLHCHMSHFNDIATAARLPRGHMYRPCCGRATWSKYPSRPAAARRSSYPRVACAPYTPSFSGRTRSRPTLAAAEQVGCRSSSRPLIGTESAVAQGRPATATACLSTNWPYDVLTECSSTPPDEGCPGPFASLATDCGQRHGMVGRTIRD